MTGEDAARFDPGEALPVLERTPAVLRAWLAGLPEVWTRADEGPGTWSPFDIVGHLIDGEETDWIPRARIILAQGAGRRFVPYDRFRHLGDRATATLAGRLERFATLRTANVATLRGWSLTPEHLALTGEHPEFGRVTLAQLLATWVAHDLDHLIGLFTAELALTGYSITAIDISPELLCESRGKDGWPQCNVCG